MEGAMREYKPLGSRLIAYGTDLARPGDRAAPKVQPDSPALMVMTDLSRIEPATIDLHASMDSANQTMIRLGLRLLFVHGPDGHLAGLITATDILGEKPMRLVQERGIKHDEVQVADLMTPVNQLEALDYDDVAHATVGHIVATLKAARRQHTLVVERGQGGGVTIRGIFSVSQISRQLGATVQTTEAATTFSELVANLV
jgi:CBS domain containing-hemolysin-like protein